MWYIQWAFVACLSNFQSLIIEWKNANIFRLITWGYYVSYYWDHYNNHYLRHYSIVMTSNTDSNKTFWAVRMKIKPIGNRRPYIWNSRSITDSRRATKY